MAAKSALPMNRDEIILLAGRLALGAIFLKSGLQKLFGLGAFAASLGQRGVPAPEAWAAIGATVEVVGGLLILVGWHTRYAALLSILFVIVATGIAHRFWEYADVARRAQESQFFKNLAIIGGLMLLYVTGAGRYSLDYFQRRWRETAPRK